MVLSSNLPQYESACKDFTTDEVQYGSKLGPEGSYPDVLGYTMCNDGDGGVL